MTELKIIPPVILHILPFLTAAVRLRLAQAGSSALRQLILGEPYEKEAFMEYLRMSMLMSVDDTLGKPPFKLHILNEWKSASSERKSVSSDLKKIRRKRLVNGLQTWHAVCARVSFYLRPAIDEKWNGTQSNFEALGTESCNRMYRYSELKRVVFSSRGSRDAVKLLFLLRFGLDESMVVKLAPLELLDTEDGSVVQKFKLRLRRSQDIRIEEDISVREFFSWNYARKSCAPGDTDWLMPPKRWTEDLCQEYLIDQLWSLGFKPQLDSTYSDDDDDDAKVVMYGDGCLYGNRKVLVPFAK